MKIGFIGLGIMGKPMVRNLINAGYEVKAYDIVRENLDAAISYGAEEGKSGAEIASECPVVITMLPNSPHVKTVVLGENGVLEGAKSGLILIDMSSIDPNVSKEIGALCAEKGVSTVVHCGDLGAGNTTKLANQIIVAGNIAVLAEALTMVKKAGVDPQVVFEAIKGGLAGSTVMNAKAPMMIEGNFKPGFRVDLHIKDLGNALDTAHKVGSPVPITAMVQEMFETLHADGRGSDDHSSLANFYAKVSGTKIGK